MTTTLAEKIARLKPDQQAEIAAEAARLRGEYMAQTDRRGTGTRTPRSSRSVDRSHS